MIRRVVFANFFFLFLLQLTAQNGEKALIFFKEAKYDSALIFADKAIADGAEDDLSALYKLKGDILGYQNRIQESVEFYKKAILLIESSEIKDLNLLGESHSGMAFSFSYLGLYEKAIHHQRIGLSYAIKLTDSVEIASGYFNLATYSIRLSQYDSAVVYLSRAYEIDLAAEDSSAISSDLNSLGALYGRMGEYEKALQYHEQSISFLKPTEINKIASRYNNMGMMELELGRLVDAEIHLLKSLSLHKELNDSLKIAQRRQNLGKLYGRMEQYEKAKIFVLEAIDYYQRAGNQYFEANGRIQLSQAYEKLGDSKRAIDEVKKAIPLAERASNLQILIKAYQSLVSLYEKSGRTTLALNSLKKQKLYEDSAKNSQKISAINGLELKFVTEQKEKEIELLEVRNQLTQANLAKQRRTVLLLTIGLIVLIAAGISVFVTQRQKFRLKEELLSQEADNLRLQINALLGTGDQKIEVELKDVNDKLKETLSEREFDILQLAITEKSNREIAEEIFVSVNTVKFHLKNIYEKLGVSNRKEALQFVIKE